VEEQKHLPGKKKVGWRDESNTDESASSRKKGPHVFDFLKFYALHCEVVGD